jgi:uncharacterized membrane protein
VTHAAGESIGVAAPSRPRLASLDLVRGIVMVLMAIDHVRVYSGVPAGGPSYGVFFTRWVTHFCAPAFVFFAGTAAFLHFRKINNRAALSRYLVTRGLLLVALELTVIKFFWTFQLDYSGFVLAGVIWMLGWCMVLMAALIWLPVPAIGALGVAIIAGQSLFGGISEFVYPSGQDFESRITILYTIVPWIGVMAAGYALGAILERDESFRRKWCLRIGIGLTLAFVVGAFIRADSTTGQNAPLIISLLNQQKYPASPLFLMMTLGPAIALLPLVERARGWLASVLITFGRVPMFYYLLHIPLIHVLAIIVWRIRDGVTHPVAMSTAPYVQFPEGVRWSLWLLYAVFIAAVFLLYWPSKWFAEFKSRRRDAWLSYI